MKILSSRLDPVKPSASAWVSQAAKEARARGEDVIDLGLGEPDFDTPEHIKHAAHAAAVAGQTKYPPTGGTLALRQAVADKLRRESDLTYDVDQIMVAKGAKQVIFNAMMATLEEGDEVLLCAPYFGQYKDIVLILGGRPVAIPCAAEDGFLLQPDDLARAITPRTRWIMLNLPSNPAGAVYSDDDLRALGAVLAEHPNVLILSDEIYEHILFDGRKFRSFAALNPELKDRTLTVNGVSKAYAMTGWRIGYGAGPKALIGGMTLDAPGGAFYAFIGCAALIGARTPDGQIIKDDSDVTAWILKSAGVAAVPGSAYDMSPFFRISTAASETVLDAAMTRIAAAVAQLEKDPNR